MSRQKSSLPWDLLEAALLTLLAIALTMLPQDLIGISALLGVVLVIFVPGYAVVLALFPRASDLAMKERMLLSLGSSVVIAALAAISLSILGRIALSTFAQALAIISLALIAAAYIRWAMLPAGWRFTPIFGSDILQPGRRKSSKDQRMAYAVLLSLAAVIVVSAYAYSGHNSNANNANTITIMAAASPAENGAKKFTEFSVLDQSSKPAIEAGSRNTITAGLINHEQRTTDYTLRLVINGSILSEKSLQLNNNNSWEGSLSYTIGSPVNMQRVDLLLYKDGDFNKPYDERNIWVNVTRQAEPQNGRDEGKPEGQSNNESESKQASLPANGVSKLEHDGGSSTLAVNQENLQPSAPKEKEPAPEETLPTDVSANVSSAQLSEQKEGLQKTASENLSFAGENNSSRPVRINESPGNIIMNFSSGDRTMNATGVDQKTSETAKNNITRGQENSSAIKSPESKLNNGFKSFSNNISVPSINNITSANPYTAPQKFYTRARPGSIASKEAVASEISAASEKGKSEESSQTSNNGAYESKSSPGTDKTVSGNNQGIAAQKISDKSNGEVTQNSVLQQTEKNVNIPNEQISVSSGKASSSQASSSGASSGMTSYSNTASSKVASINVSNQTNKSTNKTSNVSKKVPLKPKASAPQDEETVRMAAMSKKIDSWVSTRGMNPANSSGSYNSDIIKFNNANNSVVLGSQSSKAKKLG